MKLYFHPKHLVFAAALAGGTPCLAQFRTSEPPVLSIQAEESIGDDGATVADAFRRRYDKAGKPGVALFWNRELSDQISRSSVQRQAVTGNKRETANETLVPNGKRVDRHESTSQVTEVSTYTPSDPARDGLDERSESMLRSAFMVALGSGGLRPVDRSMMVRLAATQASGAQDVQMNETRGLQGRARYLLEVLLVRDKATLLGVGFQVTVKDVSSAAVLFSEYTAAQPPQQGPGRWIGVDGGAGFVREAPPPVTVRDVGRVLGLGVLARLSATL